MKFSQFSVFLLAVTLGTQCLAKSRPDAGSDSGSSGSWAGSGSVSGDGSGSGSGSGSDSGSGSGESPSSNGSASLTSSSSMPTDNGSDSGSNFTSITGSGSNSTSSGNGTTSGSGNFAGSNLYYAAGLSADQRKTYLSALKDANMKVLRVWLDGQSSGSTKGTKITSFPSLEPNAIGTYDDTVLNLYDDFMIDAHSYGIKVRTVLSIALFSQLIDTHLPDNHMAKNNIEQLMISFHSFNALQGKDVYGSKYGISNFYTDSTAQSQYDARIKHVMEHQHKSLGKQWKELSDYIFAFETQNEAMIGNGESFIQAHQNWQCDRAKTIKSELGGNSGILVTTGGASWVDESLQPDWFTCDSLDVLAIHGYGTGDFDTSKLKTYVDKAKSSNKKLIFQEWGACYFSTSNNNCPTGSALGTDQRNSNIKKWASAITDAGLPWLYWQAIPNADPHSSYDFEVGITGDGSWETLREAAQAASQASSAFDFSSYLLS